MTSTIVIAFLIDFFKSNLFFNNDILPHIAHFYFILEKTIHKWKKQNKHIKSANIIRDLVIVKYALIQIYVVIR